MCSTARRYTLYICRGWIRRVKSAAWYRRAAARLYVVYETIGYIHIIYVGNILLSVVSKKIPPKNQ